VFEYVRAEGTDHALALLTEHGDEAKPVAGGQSLVPLLNLRLARPSVIVDVNDLPLDQVETVAGTLRTGALVRHRTLCLDPAIGAANPLLARAATFIGHTAIRNRGTVGGSIAHADPSAELSLVAVVCAADISVSSAAGSRSIAARDFFRGPFTTDLEPEEAVIGISWPALDPSARWGFAEIAERTGDFADAAAAVLVRGGTAEVAVAGVPGSPVLLPAAGQWMSSGEDDLGSLRETVRAEIQDLSSRAGTSAHVLRLVEQMVVNAFGRARTQEDSP
jgi:carbon-monoxide dehydrogenase medium subunit